MSKYPKIRLNTRVWTSVVLVVLLLAPFSYAAGTPETCPAPDQIQWGFLLMGAMGGLALFLFGMATMSRGMKRAAGQKMRSFLSSVTQNRFVGLGIGALVTMIIQSSSATTVMLVSFVQAELLRFSQTLAVILGADIGTTVTAQLVAFRLTDYALLMIAVGFFLRVLAKEQSLKSIGDAIFGFGILFFGMKLMNDSMSPLRDYEPFLRSLEGLENPILGILVGAIFTAVIQSSSAFTGIIIVLAQQQLITLEAGIPLIMGSNIGTCATAALGSLGTSPEAKRVAIAHVVFKIGGVLLFVFWIPSFAELIRHIGTYFDSSVARQVANAHTVFNVALALVFLPFLSFFARIVYWILPKTPKEKISDKDLLMVPLHLDDSFISTPSIAIDLARKEISRMANILRRMVDAVLIPFMDDEEHKDQFFPHLTIIEGIEMRENKIDFLFNNIEKYLIKLNQEELTSRQAEEVFHMLSISNDIESIGDIIYRNTLPLISKKRALKSHFSEEGIEELTIFHQKVCKQVSRVHVAFARLNPRVAKRSMEKMELYLDMESEYRARHLERLCEKRLESVETHAIHMALLDHLKQINVHAGEIAKTIVKMSVKLPQTQPSPTKK